MDGCLAHSLTNWNDVSGEARRRQRFDSLFEAHRHDVASYCSWRTASRADAEDAVAEVFLVAWRKIDVVPPGEAARDVVVRHRPQGHRQHETIAASPGCLGGSHLPGAPCR